MKPFGYIYLIINIQNHKMYGGKTTEENVIEYIKDHFYYAYKNKDNGTKYFYNAIRKYGKKNFKWVILWECYSREELNESEIAVIYHYRLYGADGEHFDNIYGYNMTKGGEGGDTCSTPELKKQKHDAQVAYFQSPEGKAKTLAINTEIRNRPEVKEKKRIKMSGKDNPAYRHDIDDNEIKNLFKQGIEINDIASRFNCSRTLIYTRAIRLEIIKQKKRIIKKKNNTF